MASIRSLSLRRKLPLLVSTLTAGALVVAGTLAYVEVRGSAIQAVEARLAAVTAELANASSTAQAGRLARDSVLARSPVVLDALRGRVPDSAALAAELATLRAAGVEENLPVMLIGPDDRTIFSIGDSITALDPDPDPELDSVNVYGPYRNVGGEILFWNSFPVRTATGEMLGWVAHRRRIAPQPAAGSLVESLLGTGIRFLIGTPGDSVWVDLMSRTLEGPPARVQLSEPYTYQRADGDEVLAVGELLPPTPQVVVLQMPMAQVLERPHAFLSRMALMGVSLVLLVILLAGFASRRLTSPLEDLAAAAETMAGGDYRRRVRLDGGDDEVARVARSFNSMSEQVARSDEALRNRLDEARALAVRLEEANVTAERAREDAQTASRAKSEFLATMSHELRTPINAVLGYTELLELGIPDAPTEKQKDYLRRIDRSSRLLIALVDDVLDFSRIESGRLRLEMGVGSTVDAVFAAVGSLEPDAIRKGIALTTRCADGGRFRGDQQRVQQILLNLLSNAVKFTPSGGSVSVSCALDGVGPPKAEPGAAPWVRVDVEDTGIGIDPDQLTRVFEPFVQGTVGFTREHGGAGLGLAISRSLASMMAGEITVESTRGKGSRFTLWLRAVGAGEPQMVTR
jgi:signal transduction histidine kinase